MAAKSKAHGFRCKILQHLEKKKIKAHQLKCMRIGKISCKEGSETIKFVAIVRDIQR
jgi:hypothetical protein